VTGRLAETGPNAEQIRYWKETGARWIAGQELLDAQLEPFGQETMARVGMSPGERVVDVGCGCGATTIEIAQRVGKQGMALGIDLSYEMLEVARRRAEGTIARFANVDAQTHAFEPASFDVVFSRFGVMFFADPSAAFANLRRALRRDGRLGFICWQALDRNPWLALSLGVTARFVAPPPPPAPDAPGPFSLADQDRVRKILAQAGFVDATLTPREGAVRVGGTADLNVAVSFLMAMGPTGAALREADEATRARVAGALREALLPFHTKDGVSMHSAAWIVTARSPA
jgi:SAM-dependent methyltransferase